MDANVNEKDKEQELKNSPAPEITAEPDHHEEDTPEDHHDELHPVEDVAGLGKDALLAKLEETLAHQEQDHIHPLVLRIKEVFREHVNEEQEAKRRKWEETREDDDEKFEPAPDPLAEKFEELIRGYNKKRSEQRRKKETELRLNLQRKLSLIDELKALAETSESMNKAFEKLQDIQVKWREAGPVPLADAEEVRKNWQFHLDRFFDVVKISRELRELDHRKNAELKEDLVAKAVALADEPSVRRALDELHKLHEHWREIGPAAKEANDQLWEKFKAASDKIHERRQVLLQHAKETQLENLVAKTALCEKMEGIAAKEYHSHKDWLQANDAIENVFAEWKKIGFVPKEDEGKTWKRFRDARQKFFHNRETYYAKQREVFAKNLELKTALCEKAEALKDNTDWKNTANEFRNLQEEWKKSGPVSRRQSEKIWQRFKAAADAFFENRSKHFAEQDAAFKANGALREAIIAEAAGYEPGEDLTAAKEMVLAFQKRWAEMPPAPRNDRERLDKSWKEAMDKIFAKLKENGGDENFVHRIRYDQMKQTDRGREQLSRERMHIQDKIKRLQGEINTLETNLGFFSKSKGAQELVADYQSQVEKHKAEIDTLKAKLKMIPREERVEEPVQEKKKFNNQRRGTRRF